jgi:hypothetical protein
MAEMRMTPSSAFSERPKIWHYLQNQCAHALGKRGDGIIIGEWQRRFDKSIVLPDGGELVTLLDAGLYIESLPEVHLRGQEWRIATEMLLAVADGRWPVAFAEIAIRQALKTGRPPPLPPLQGKVAKKLKLIR